LLDDRRPALDVVAHEGCKIGDAARRWSRKGFRYTQLQALEVVTRFQELGAERVGPTPEAVAQLVAREIDVWSDVVRRSGVKVN